MKTKNMQHKIKLCCIAILFAFTGYSQTGNDCSRAINLALSSSVTTTYPNGKLYRNTEWFKFTANANPNPIIIINEKQNADKWTVKSVNVYRGTCTHLTLVSTFSVTGINDTVLVSPLHHIVSGHTYYIELVKGTLNPCTSPGCIPNDTAYYGLKVDGGLAGMHCITPNGTQIDCEHDKGDPSFTYGGQTNTYPPCQINICVGDDLTLGADWLPSASQPNYWYYQTVNSLTPTSPVNFYVTTISTTGYFGQETGYFTATPAMAGGTFYIYFSDQPPTPAYYNNTWGVLQINVSPMPNYAFTASPNPTCLSGQPITFNVSPAASSSSPYTINFGDPAGTSNNIYNTQTFTYPANGVYNASVNFSDINGDCAETLTTNIVIETPAISATANSICVGQTSTIVVNSNVSGLNYSFSPSTGVTGTYPNFYVHPNTTTTYNITGTIPGTSCTSSTAVTVNVNPSTPPPILSGTLCSGATNTLTITNYNASDVYTWTPSTGVNTSNYPTVIITNPSTGTHYTVTATNPVTGCVSSHATITVFTSPSITVTPTTTLICEGTTVDLNATTLHPTNGVVTWSSAVTCIAPNAIICHHVAVTPGVTTNYTATVINPTTGCSAFAVATVNVNPTPTVAIISNPNPAVFCSTVPGSSVNLTASTNGSTYTWAPATGLSCTSCLNPIANPPTGSTTYTFTSTGADGCSARQQVTVTNECSCSNGTVLTHTNLTTPVFFFPGSVFSINAPSTIAASFTLTDKTIFFGPGVSLTVLSGHTLTLRHCHLLACSDMWQGIIVQPGGNLIVENNSMIEDAYVAINCPNWIVPTSAPTNSLTVDGCVFNRNQIGIKLSEASVLSYGSTNNFPANIKNSVFTCRTIAWNYIFLPFFSTNVINWAAPTPATLKGLVGTSTPLQTPYELANNPAYAITTLKAPLTGTVSNWGVYLAAIGSSSLNGTSSPSTFLTTANSYYDATIGDNSTGASAATLNLFDNHWIGIYAANSCFTSVNNAFELMYSLCIPTAAASCPATSGVAIYGVNNQLGSYHYTRANVNYPGYVAGTPPATIPAANSNTFYDCAYSALIEKYQEVNIVGNNVRSRKGSGITSLPTGAGLYGFYVNTLAYQHVNMSYNQVTNITNGITFAASTGSSQQARGIAHADNNSISAFFGTTPTYQFVSNAIQMDNSTNCYPGTGVTCTTRTTSIVTASNNTLQQVYRGIEMSNWYNPKAYSHNQANSNYIKLLTDPSSTTVTQFGINVNNSVGNDIVDNNIIGTGTGNLNMRGIYSVDNTTGPVSCNFTGTLGKGLEFEGPSPSLTTVWGAANNDATVSTNTMVTNQHGFALSGGAILSNQGSSAAASDNQWTGTWTGSNYGTYVDASTMASNTPIYIRTLTTSSPYYPQNCSPIPPGNNYCLVSGLLNTAPAGTGVCSALPEPPCTTCPLSGKSIAQRIVQDSAVFPVLAIENGFRAKLDIFRAMLADSSIQDSSAILKNFFLANQTAGSSINTIVNIESNLAQGNMTTAQSMNAAFAPATTIEANHKALFSSMINYANTDSLNPSDSLTLITLAQSCPATAGDAVYQARAVYNAAYNQYQYFANNCNYDSLAAAHAARLAKTSGINAANVNSNSSLLVYPNPSTGDIFISGSDINDKTWTIEITDVAGRIVLQNNYNVSNGLVKLSTQFTNGVYFIKVITESSFVKQQKVIISQ